MLTSDLKHTFSDLWPIYKRFFTHAKPDLSFIILTAIIILGIAATNTIMIWLIGTPFDMLQEGQFDAIYSTIILLVLIVTLNQGTHLAEGLLSRWLALRFICRLRNSFLSHILRLSFPGIANYPKGDLLSRLSNDVDEAENFILEVPFFLVSHIFTFLFYTAMLFWINWKLALLAAAITPVFLIHQQYFGPRKRYAAQEFLKSKGEMLSVEEDSLENLQGISSFAAESATAQKHESVLKKSAKRSFKEGLVDVSFNISLNLLIYIIGLIIVFAGVNGISKGYISLGHLVSFLLYLGYLSVPVSGFASLFLESQSYAAAARRIMEILDAKSMTYDKKKAKQLTIKEGRIELNNISFNYPGGIKIFSGVNLTISGGDTVALVGASGSGKSTLIKLLLRFYDPVKGAISIDGLNLRDVYIKSLRENIAVVWQKPFLFNDTIRANLLIAKLNAGEEELINACKASNSWEFIFKLKEGLDAKIGANGVELSAGQCQRLAIAQTFLRNAPILILDEASSALDSHNEQLIAKALARLRKGRTTLIIAHRYSSIKSADYVVYFNSNGNIIVDTHEKMFMSNSEYKKAVQWQTSIG